MRAWAMVSQLGFTAFLCVHVSACSGHEAEASGCVPGVDPTLEIGQGEIGFEPVSDGRIELIHGIQGGYHTTMALRAQFLQISDSPVEIEMVGYLNGEALAHAVSFTRFLCNQEDLALDAWGLRLIWDAMPEQLADQRVRIEAVITNDDGGIAQTATEFVIHDPVRQAL